MESSAIFDRTQTYRYLLRRSWEQSKPCIAFIMLNPSRADAQLNDPTIRRCLGFARTWGYGSLVVANLFGFRAANPKQLHQVEDAIGKECDRYILEAIALSRCTVIAWGNGGTLAGRDRTVLDLIRTEVYCLGMNRSGQPRHPLYVRADTPLVLFSCKTQSRIRGFT